MARVRDHRPPYWSALRLAAWAAANGGYVRSKLLGRGIEPASLGLRDLLGLVHGLMVEEYATVWAPLVEVRARLDKVLDSPDGLMPRWVVVEHHRRVEAEKRATWGRTAEAVAGYQAAMATFGGSALPKPEGQSR